MIVDYKNKLEKSLQLEKQEHKQSKLDLEGRVNEEKIRRDKTSVEANLRFTSLQQNYKLLQVFFQYFFFNKQLIILSG